MKDIKFIDELAEDIEAAVKKAEKNYNNDPDTLQRMYELSLKKMNTEQMLQGMFNTVQDEDSIYSILEKSQQRLLKLASTAAIRGFQTAIRELFFDDLSEHNRKRRKKKKEEKK